MSGLTVGPVAFLQRTGPPRWAVWKSKAYCGTDTLYALFIVTTLLPNGIIQLIQLGPQFQRVVV